MIDLTRTREDMLAEIGAGDNTAWITVRGRTPDDILPVLTKVMATRFALVPEPYLSANLTYLVKKGLGNAFKWGNGKDPEKMLSARAVMTAAGAVVAITDDGLGFDVHRVVERFLRQEAYFSHGGSGLSHFHEASSVISYADAGRTLLIRFLCASDSARPAVHAPAAAKRAKRCLGFDRLRYGDPVKVKGLLQPDGNVAAFKVSVKHVGDMAVIESALQDVTDSGRMIRMLNVSIALPDEVEIASVEGTRLPVDGLRAGQVVELVGRYSASGGLIPRRIQVRAGLGERLDEVQGAIESIDQAESSFRVVGIAVKINEQTDLRDKRLSKPGGVFHS